MAAPYRVCLVEVRSSSNTSGSMTDEELSSSELPSGPTPNGDTTSDTAGTGQSDSAGRENGDLARLLSFAFTHPVPPADRLQRRALLDARSVAELTHVLRGRYSPLGSAQVIADLRQELGVLQTLQGDQARRLDSLASENAELRENVEEAELERSLWEREAKKASSFLTSPRKALAKSEAALKLVREKQDRKIKSAFKHSADHALQIKRLEEEVVTLTKALADRDHAYAELHAVSTKHFEQLQESTSLLLDGGSQPLRHAKSVIDSQRQVILRQKRVFARQGPIPMHDPHWTFLD
ncbi:hypothetical protein PR003_g30656 [Phytophthora rubi]|uniref:Uncharacterized protein n=1 Tax=Phytophthora rubi TaxID=129364 RepID=A0A6A4BBE9_9STRA|nr:hypothetical protein PR002_g30383 [Phytophthora rubi]KAE8962277.1 hypothetical protein PR001_g29756 [Phytophthora rubi]KAE9270970.1 hypothetical protein PR003_g30656 [Phytophthora rubi]